jgi:hypothetical protein
VPPCQLCAGVLELQEPPSTRGPPPQVESPQRIAPKAPTPPTRSAIERPARVGFLWPLPFLADLPTSIAWSTCYSTSRQSMPVTPDPQPHRHPLLSDVRRHGEPLSGEPLPTSTPKLRSSPRQHALEPSLSCLITGKPSAGHRHYQRRLEHSLPCVWLWALRLAQVEWVSTWVWQICTMPFIIFSIRFNSNQIQTFEIHRNLIIYE